MKKAGIRITKKCNFRCKYCNIPNNFKEELSLKEWKKAINILKGKGVEELVILGGEPTLYKDLVELVDYIENELDIRCSLTTNGLNNIEIISKLIDVGISQIGVSIDNLKKENSISPAKVICGLNLIEQLKQKYSFEKLKTKIVNYTVVNNNNINELVDIVKYMNNQNIYTYLLPFHWSKEKNFEHRKEDNRYAIKDIKEYENIMNKLKRLKKDKIKIINSNEFLEDSKNYIKNLDWKCKSENFELRVDSDGKLACCCDKLGQVNNVYTIFDIEDNKIYTDFINLRKKDVKECEGCLWPSSYEASIYE